MKNALYLALVWLSVFSVGCMTEPLSVDREGVKVASVLGIDAARIQFVTYCDVARAEEMGGGFSPDTKGIVVVSESDIYWGLGNLENLQLDNLARVPLAQIEGASLDLDLIQLKLNGELLIIRPHTWNRFEGDRELSLAMLSFLSKNEVPMFMLTQSFASPPDYHSMMGTGLYGEASAETAAAQHAMEEADAKWAAEFGQDGVPLTPPSNRWLGQGSGREIN